MPRYDGTGPEGLGPNGRRLGPCGRDIPRPRRSFWGLGRGFRRGAWWTARQSYVDEKTGLESEKNWLSDQLEAINKRLHELEEK